MKHRDFHAGQSTLGLMTRNTEAMFAPRMAQWEAFGKGLQDANAIVQNRHAFNEQLEQNRINNEFKNKEFGFREKEAEENKRQFDIRMQEEKNQFWARHALDKENSATDRAYKNALTALHYLNINQQKTAEQRKEGEWEIAEALKNKWIADQNSLSLKEIDFLDKHGFKIDDNNKLAVKTMKLHEKYNANEKALRNIEKVLQGGDLRGIGFGIRRKINEWTGGAFGELSKEQNEHLVALSNVIDAIIQNQYGNATSDQKTRARRNLFDKYFASPEEFKSGLIAQANDIMQQQEMDLDTTLKEFGISKDSFSKYTKQLSDNKAVFEAFSKPKTKEIQRYIPPVRLMKD